MIIKAQIDNSVLHLMKQVNEDALRQCKIDGTEAIAELLQKCFEFDLWREIQLTHILRMSDTAKSFRLLGFLTFRVCKHGNSDYVIATGNFYAWKQFCIALLANPFNEDYQLSFYLQVCQLYNELVEIHPSEFTRYYKKQVIDNIFILERR